MINKRGETESYSFLIGLVITFLLLSTVGCVVYQIYSKGAETQDSFKNLVDTVKNLKDGEEGKIPVYVNEDYVIVGFRSDTDKVESKSTVGLDMLISYCYNWYTGGFDGLLIERPPACKGKACLCLCEYQMDKPKNLGKYENYIRDAAVFVTSNFCSGPEDKCVTEGIGQYNFVGEKSCQIAIIPGVKGAYYLGIKPLRTQNKIESRGVAAVYYKRNGNTIVIDDEQLSKQETDKKIEELKTSLKDNKNNINQ